MADDERDDPARPPSRGPRVVTGDMSQARAGRPGRGKTATGWAPTAPPPADPPPADPAAPAAAGDDVTAETLVGPAPAPPPAADEPRRPRVVTRGTPPDALEAPEPPGPGETTETMSPPPPARVVRPRPGPAPAWSEPDPDDLGAVIPPPVHRSATPPPAPPAPYGKPGKPGKAPKAPKPSGGPSGNGPSEPLAKRALLLAVLSIPLTALVAIAALLVAGRANRRLAARPGTTGGGMVTAARVIAVLSLLGWLAVAGLVIANLVRPDGVDYAKLKPGDCIDTPEGTEVRLLKVRSCDEPHDAEVFAVVTHPAAADDPFPGADALLAYAANACLGQPFTDYIGIPRAQSQLTEFEIVPESEAWFDGRRGLVCAVDKADRTPLTSSVRGSAT